MSAPGSWRRFSPGTRRSAKPRQSGFPTGTSASASSPSSSLGTVRRSIPRRSPPGSPTASPATSARAPSTSSKTFRPPPSARPASPPTPPPPPPPPAPPPPPRSPSAPRDRQGRQARPRRALSSSTGKWPRPLRNAAVAARLILVDWKDDFEAQPEVREADRLTLDPDGREGPLAPRPPPAPARHGASPPTRAR